MDGLDLAFYKGRSKYHTKYDAVSFMLGGQRSLWSMMETARGVGVNLLSAPFDTEQDESVPVYFDRKFADSLSLGSWLTKTPVVFKSIILVIPISKFLTLNIVALIVTPILLVLFALCEHFLAKSPTSERSPEPSEPEPSSLPRRYFHRLSLRAGALDPPEPQGAPQLPRVIYWLEVIWRHIKFWVALGITIALQFLLMWGYVLFNPFVRFSSLLQSPPFDWLSKIGYLLFALHCALGLPLADLLDTHVRSYVPLVTAILLSEVSHLRVCSHPATTPATETDHLSPSLYFYLDSPCSFHHRNYELPLSCWRWLPLHDLEHCSRHNLHAGRR